jgi:hypothetical protein
MLYNIGCQCPTVSGNPEKMLESDLGLGPMGLLQVDNRPIRVASQTWMDQDCVLDLASKKRQALADFPVNAQCLSVPWSPDGRRLAYTWTQLHPEVLKKDGLGPDDASIQTEACLIVADADGRNAKTIASGKSNQGCASSTATFSASLKQLILHKPG